MSDDTKALQQRIASLERELGETKAALSFLKGALEHVPIGFELYDQDGVAAWMNQAMAAFAGLESPEPAIGHFNVLTDPFSVQTGIDAWYRRAYAGELVETGEFSIDMGLASETWGTRPKPVRFKMILVPDTREDGHVANVFAIMFESAQHQVVRHLSEQLIHVKNQKNAATETIGSLLGEVDIFAVRVWAGDTVTALHDVDGAIKRGEQVSAWRHTGPDLPSHVAAMMERIESGTAASTTPSIHTQDNQVWLAAPILGAQGLLGLLEVGSRSQYAGAQLLPTLVERVAELLTATWRRVEAQGTFGTLFDYSPNGVVLFDDQGTVLKANPSAIRIFGHEPSSIADMFGQPDELVQAVESLKSKQLSRHWLEASGRRASGELFSADIGLASLPDRTDTMMSIRDLTQRRTLEAQLASAHAEAARLQDAKRLVETTILHLPIALILLDDDRQVVLFNYAAEDLIRELSNHTTEEQLIPGLDLEHLFAPGAPATKSGAPVELEVTTRHGDVRMLAIRNVELPIERSRYHVVSIVDLTDRVQAERAAAMEDILATRMRALKASQASERTIKAQRDELAKANKLYQAELETKRMFMANMSHELRTPLAGILGLSDILLDQGLSTVNRDYVATLRRTADALRIVVEDILDFSRMELGKIRLVEEQVDLFEIISDVLDLLAQDAQASGLELRLEIAPEVPTYLWIDPARLRQVISNLVANAVKYTHDGEVRVRVTHAHDQDLLIEVIDTGIGIAPDAMKRILEPFEQAERTYARSYGGIGLGLSIVRELLKRMGGRLEVESQAGLGSTFRIRLPADCVRVHLHEPVFAGRIAHVVHCRSSRLSSMEDMLTRLGATAHGHLAVPDASHRLQPGGMIFVDTGLCVGRLQDFGEELRQLTASGQQVVLVHGHSLHADERAVLGAHGQLATMTHPVRLSSFQRLLPNSEPSKSPEPVETQDLRILIVDDNAVNRTVTGKMVERFDIQADLVKDGATAVSMADIGRHLLILMDLQMPLMDGYETTKRIRSEHNPNRDIFIVAFTAHTGEDERTRALQSGFDAFTTKPLRRSELERAVRAALERRQGVPAK